ncbi:hypothetical protein JKP88DRAFT_136002, partial [Tribonema minus]
RHSEPLQVELLKLMTLMMEFLPQEMAGSRRELLKFGWDNIKKDWDLVSKHWAYVNLCKFISMYSTPLLLVLQVYVALLRTHQPEVKELVRVALDILVPALPRRLGPQDMLKCIKWTRKIMYEESHMMTHLIHIWHMVVRHPAIFYPYRGQFLQQVVTHLPRLGLQHNCPFEQRALSVALSDVVLAWE